jgi:hydroxyacylglutathione hydrolase
MLTIFAVPAFKDNYIWVIHDGTHATVVDPGDAAPVLSALKAHGLSLVAILLTHHHADHVGGVHNLKKNFDVPVFGPQNEAIEGITIALDQSDIASIPELSLHLSVLNVPGHTLGHIAYHAAEQQWIFCGDTLFAGGCGRLFEGTPAQMTESLEKLAALSDATQVYCAHEYTLSNLRFAQEIEPGNAKLIERITKEQDKRNRGQPTVPSTIGMEKETNPFLRIRETAIVQRLIKEGRIANADPVAVFAALREWKNSYQG